MMAAEHEAAPQASGRGLFYRASITPAPLPACPHQTWLRVALGYHTWPQVIVGGLLGASTAGAWFAWGAGAAVPALRAQPLGLPVLYATTVVGVVLFAARNVLSWHEERRASARAKLRASDDGNAAGGWVPAPTAG